jgi:hypothetical protein
MNIYAIVQLWRGRRILPGLNGSYSPSWLILEISDLVNPAAWATAKQ